MKPYEFVEHTADAEFYAYGSTIEEAFSNAAYALAEIVFDSKKVKPAATKNLKIAGADEKALLYSFLEEFIFLLDAEDFVLHKVESIEIRKKEAGWELDAEVSGDIAGNYQVEKAVKAATYNQMEIKSENGKWTLHVVVDI